MQINLYCKIISKYYCIVIIYFIDSYIIILFIARFCKFYILILTGTMISKYHGLVNCCVYF